MALGDLAQREDTKARFYFMGPCETQTSNKRTIPADCLLCNAASESRNQLFFKCPSLVMFGSRSWLIKHSRPLCCSLMLLISWGTLSFPFKCAKASSYFQPLPPSHLSIYGSNSSNSRITGSPFGSGVASSLFQNPR